MLTKFLSLGLLGLTTAQVPAPLQSNWFINGNRLSMNNGAIDIVCEGIDDITQIKQNDLFASFNVKNNQDNSNEVQEWGSIPDKTGIYTGRR